LEFSIVLGSLFVLCFMEGKLEEKQGRWFDLEGKSSGEALNGVWD
jgi:hypothetical protein